jgi:uncharacterized protein
MKLRISDDLVLGADFVTSTQAILAQKGKGKSYAAAVEAEELLDAKQVVVIVDPTDAHFGLRSSPDGRSTGYPIVVFGGDHGDIQLESGGGAVLAEAIVRERFSAIICTETMTKSEELRFIADFLETLYRKNREAMHLFLDEADIFAPQQPYGGEARTCGATDDIVRRGRKKGIGCTLITQRASVLNKNVLSQADMLIAMGCSHPLDLDAIDKWIRRNADPKLAAEMLTSLPSLPRGEAWAWNPSQHLFKRVAIRRRHTFDSGATPKAGEKKREPKILAPIDIARLGKAMSDAVERQRESDPKALRAKIAELVKERDQLSRAVNTIPAPKGETKIVEKPVIKDGQFTRAEKLVESVGRLADITTARVEKTIEEVRGTFGGAIARLEQSCDDLRAAIKLATAASPPVTKPVPQIVRWKDGKEHAAPINGAGRRNLVSTKQVNSDAGSLSRMERNFLTAIAQHETRGGLTRRQVLLVTGYAQGGATARAFARLTADTFVTLDASGALRATARGLAELGDYEPMPTGRALQKKLLNGDQLGPMEKSFLARACGAYPEAISRRDALGDYAQGGATARAFARLIGMGYLTKTGHGSVCAAEELFE